MIECGDKSGDGSNWIGGTSMSAGGVTLAAGGVIESGAGSSAAAARISSKFMPGGG